MKLSPGQRRWLGIGLAVVGLIVVGVLVKLSRGRTKTAAIVTEAVSRRDIARTIEATGTVEPIDLVDVKSKASGQIVKMPVQVGSQVRAGDLLAQIDTRDVQNQYNQTLAALRAAESKVDISKAQMSRSDELFNQGVITATEHESATLDYANSQAAVVKARTDMDLAKQHLDDATVRAPVAGTVLQQLVSSGQVISSATSSASGGTSLLQMADLSRIRLRALVSETDIGSVHTGQQATVTVDAFPNRTFQGVVEKIEPQAVVQQSVTMFPVLISISNEAGLLLPGMNGEVVMLVESRENVLAIPVDAVRTAREVPVVATALGLQPDSVRAQVQRQIEAQAREFAARRAAMGDSGRRGEWMAGASYSSDSSRAMGGRHVRGDSSAAGMRGMRRRGGGGAGQGGGGWTGRSGGGAGGSGRGPGGGSMGGSGTGGGMMGGGGGGMGMRGNRAQVVFVKTAQGLEPRVVRLGLSDFDYFEVVQGLNEGEQVALLGVAEAQASRQETQNQIRQRMGGGMPGVPGGGRVGGGGGGGGGAGAGAGGGGRGRGGS